MTQKLRELMARAESWPEAVQQEAVAHLRPPEEEFLEPYELTEADRQAIERGLRAAVKGRSATEAEAVFANYRQSGR